MGATVIEKHFTLDQSLPGPDHKASLTPSQLSDMVAAIRNVEQALGHGTKLPSPSERKNMVIARKSIHLAHPIKKGQVLSEADLTVKRPGNGISPMLMNEIVGCTVIRDLEEDTLLSFNDLLWK
jgi:N,N'-diacetyllegionaminate synthase